MEAGDELALYEHLKAQEAETGPVPNTPEILVEATADSGPAQEKLEDPELSAKVAEMRARLIKEALELLGRAAVRLVRGVECLMECLQRVPHVCLGHAGEQDECGSRLPLYTSPSAA
ncbi:hypothetical protein ABZU94_39155 [Streptomyces mirabilis]|uniref:hypothetical protein n=1 Tax=Streptomyces sp. NPDC005388 TaxID=3156717 RepID=UPI0033A5A117